MGRCSIYLPDEQEEFCEAEIERRPEFDGNKGFSQYLQYLVRKEQRELEGRKPEKRPK